MRTCHYTGRRGGGTAAAGEIGEQGRLINDRCGHPTGGFVLKEFARLSREGRSMK
jgi:hypothetical protein